MTPPAQDAYLSLVDSVRTLLNEQQSTPTWLARSLWILDRLEQLNKIVSASREFRRVYGSEVEEAVLNQLDLRLDQAHSSLIENLRICIHKLPQEK